MIAIRYSVMFDVYIGHCCLLFRYFQRYSTPSLTIYQICCNISLNLEVYRSAKCSSLFSALWPLISDLSNICGQDHSKKLTIQSNSSFVAASSYCPTRIYAYSGNQQRIMESLQIFSLFDKRCVI